MVVLTLFDEFVIRNSNTDDFLSSAATSWNAISLYIFK